MDVVATLTDAVPLLIVTILGGWLLNGRLNRLEAKIDRLTGRVDGVELKVEGRPPRDEIDRRFDRLESRVDSQFDSLRSDITQIALAVGARTRPETG